MTGAGEMRERVTFDAPRNHEDGAGGMQQGFIEQFTTWAKRTPLRQGETVLAARLTGTSVAVFRIRANPTTRRITAGWQCRHGGMTYNIRGAELQPDRAFIDVLAEGGVAT